MANIIDEIAEVRHDFLLQGMKPNTVIIPESRREEIRNAALGFTRDWPFDPNARHTVFGCEIMYSSEADKIKVGYLKQ